MSKNKKIFKNSGYSGGAGSLVKKTLKSWLPNHFSAVSDIDFNLATVRARAADLYFNSAIGAAAINSVVSGVVNEGLKLFPRLNHTALNLSIEDARSWEEKTKREFELWSETVECDFYRRNTFREIQRIAFLNELCDGDCACLFRRKNSASENPYTLRLQLIEAGRITNPQNTGGTFTSNVEMLQKNSRIVNGVEVDGSGILKALWIANKIPAEFNVGKPLTEWKRVKFFGEKSGEQNLCFLCNDSRIEQFRGVPYLAPVVEILKNISRYTDAELTSEIINSYFSLFFTQPYNADINYNLNQIVDDDEDTFENLDVTEIKIGPGTLTKLPRGTNVETVNPSGASSTFESFTTQLFKQVGAALNLPYEVLLKNFQSSYSASKAALLQAENEFRQRRESFKIDFLTPVYRIFLSEAVALGRIDAPGFFDDALTKNLWCNADWRNSTTYVLDPQKEVQAAKLRLELGLSNHTKEAAELCGIDYSQNLKNISKEEQLRQNLFKSDLSES